jgi:hypothetical protein
LISDPKKSNPIFTAISLPNASKLVKKPAFQSVLQMKVTKAKSSIILKSDERLKKLLNTAEKTNKNEYEEAVSPSFSSQSFKSKN